MNKVKCEKCGYFSIRLAETGKPCSVERTQRQTGEDPNAHVHGQNRYDTSPFCFIGVHDLSSESDGSKPVVVSVQDPAGNSSEDTSTSVVFDFTPPTMLAKMTTPAVAPSSTPVVVSLTLSEDVRETVVPVPTASPALPGPSALAHIADSAYDYTYTTPPLAGQQSHSLTLDVVALGMTGYAEGITSKEFLMDASSTAWNAFNGVKFVRSVGGLAATGAGALQSAVDSGKEVASSTFGLFKDEVTDFFGF